MGENNNSNENVTVNNNNAMPQMTMPTFDVGQNLGGTSHVTSPKTVDLNQSIFGTSTYQMVVGKRNASIDRFEAYKVTKPAVAREIEDFVARFDYKNPEHIQKFAAPVMGQHSLKHLAEYVKNNKDSEVYDDIRVMLLDFIDEMKPRPVNKSFGEKLREFFDKKKAESQKYELEQARIDEIIDVMTKRVEYNLAQVVTKDRTEIVKFLGTEQQKALFIDKFVIAGELILKKMEEEYLPVLKAEYDKDPTSVDKKLALKEAEERTIEFLARLNNVITSSGITLINVDASLKEKEINKRAEIFLQDILDNTIPILAQQCMLNMINKNSKLPIEETMKIQQITEEIFKKNAQEVGELYVATIEQSGRPFISIETLETVAGICKEATQRADEVKKEQLKIQMESHERLEKINNELKISATEMAYKTMSKKELEEMQKVADSFKPTL